jgi:hypothetical protein
VEYFFFIGILLAYGAQRGAFVETWTLIPRGVAVQPRRGFVSVAVFAVFCLPIFHACFAAAAATALALRLGP